MGRGRLTSALPSLVQGLKPNTSCLRALNKFLNFHVIQLTNRHCLLWRSRAAAELLDFSDFEATTDSDKIREFSAAGVRCLLLILSKGDKS